MDYNLGWGSTHPGHLVYLVDLSGSMKGNKIKMAMDALRNSLRLLITRCTQGDEIIERFSVTIIGYHTDIVPLFSGNVEDAYNLFRRANGGPLFNYENGGIAEPKWQTYMSNAFNAARMDIEEWMRKNNGKECPAPIVVNITDGQPEEDGKSLDVCAREALQAASNLKNLRTTDGNVLLFNFHIGKSGIQKEIILPSERPSSTGDQKEDMRIGFLYDCASVLTQRIVTYANSFDLPARTGSRGIASNVEDTAILVRLVEFSSSLGMQAGTETPKP